MQQPNDSTDQTAGIAASKEQITRVAAYGLVTDSDHILLCRISASIPRLAGQWTLPGGGVEFREDPADAMVREVQEETGIIVESAGLAGIDSHAVDTEHVQYHGIRILYHTRQMGGVLTSELEGTTDMCQWWHRSELAKLLVVDLVRVGVGHIWRGEPTVFTRSNRGNPVPGVP